MIKNILVLSSFLLIVGCASTDESSPEENDPAIEASEDTTIDSQSISLSEDLENESDLETEDDQEIEGTDDVQIEPMRPWEEFEDINEFMKVRHEEKQYTVADAAELENQVELAFQEELPEDSYRVTGRWSGFVFTFADQMEDEFSEEYINKMLELNDSIASVRYEGSVEEIQQLVQEAREIRESE